VVRTVASQEEDDMEKEAEEDMVEDLRDLVFGISALIVGRTVAAVVILELHVLTKSMDIKMLQHFRIRWVSLL